MEVSKIFILQIIIPICEHFLLIENRTAEDFDLFSYLICFSVGQLFRCSLYMLIFIVEIVIKNVCPGICTK